MEAFVYCWTDLGTNKLYVGVHKGTPEDGYVCSSKLMLEEYTKRPNDFSRQIVAYGSFKEMYVLETAILKAAKADKDLGFYNQHVNSMKGCQFTLGTKRPEHSKLMLGNKHALNSRYPRPEEFKQARKGNKFALGVRYKRTPEQNIARSIRQKGKKWDVKTQTWKLVNRAN